MAAGAAPRVGLVTALLPPIVGGTQVLIGRLFQGDDRLAVVSGVSQQALASQQGYAALAVPTLYQPYPRLRGYRFGFGPALGVYAAAWLAKSLPRVVRFLQREGVEHVVSVPHQGPFALLGLLAARQLGIAHTLYILDAWEEAETGFVERKLVRWGLRVAARTAGSRLAAVSPALAAHYRSAFGFRDVTWIPNPAPLSSEWPALGAPSPQPSSGARFVLFSGGIKSFNIDTVRLVLRSMRYCTVVDKLVLTGLSLAFEDELRQSPELRDRVECRICSQVEIASLQRQASVLLIATNVDDDSQTSLGYLPGRLPEYVATGRPILLIGPPRSDAARAVRHWRLGPAIASQDEREVAKRLDQLAAQSLDAEAGKQSEAESYRDLFLQVFSRTEARRRLLREPAPLVSPEAARVAAEFEREYLARKARR